MFQIIIRCNIFEETYWNIFVIITSRTGQLQDERTNAQTFYANDIWRNYSTIPVSRKQIILRTFIGSLGE